MSQRHKGVRRLRAWLTIGGLLAMAIPFGTAADTQRPPNILLIMADDLGWMDLNCQGNPYVHTPRLDALAAEGMRFTDAYASAPVCSPTRAAVMTGLAPARLQITNHLPHQDRFTPKEARLLPAPMKDHLALEYTTIAERLGEDAGYATAFIGKWHLYKDNEHKYAPQHQGFDINLGGCSFGGPRSFFDPYRNPFLEDREKGEYLPDRLADEVLVYIEQQAASEKPFFVSWFPYTVHWPMEAPESYLRKYRDRPVKGYRDYRYAAMIEAMDGAVGRVLDTLSRLKIQQETIVIFTSDNGPFGGVGDPAPLRADKGHLYEGGIRVPLIVRYPGVTDAGLVNSDPVILTDLYPTLLEAAGLSVKDGYPNDGASLLSTFRNEETDDRPIFWHYPNYAFHGDNRLGSAVRMGRYKLIEFFDDKSVELYDLREDVGEAVDLSDQKPEIAGRLRNRLREWRAQVGAALPVPR